jgi:hypothetical protein
MSAECLSRKMFLTATFSTRGDQTDNPIVNANQECQNRADAAGLQGQYKAWLSTGPTNFDTAGYSPVRNFVKCGSYVLPGGDGPDVAYDGFTGLIVQSKKHYGIAVHAHRTESDVAGIFRKSSSDSL